MFSDAESIAERATVTDTVEEIPLPEKGPQKSDNGSDVANTPPLESKLEKEVEAPQHPIEGPWILPKNLWILLRHRAYPFVYKVLTHGAGVDIHALQAGKQGTKEGERMQKIYERATQYPNETEHLYSFMQVMTACTASFAHGYVRESRSKSISDLCFLQCQRLE